MNRHLIASLRALPVTLLLFAVSLSLAVPIVLPLSLTLEGLLPARWDAPTQAALLDGVMLLRPLWRALGVQGALALGSWFVASPLLHMAWLSALSTPMSPVRALGRGISLLPRALLVTVVVWLAVAALATPFGLLAYGLSTWLSVESNARVHDLAVLCALAPVVATLLIGFTWHDLARARGLEKGFFRSVRQSARGAFRPATLARAILFAGAGTGLVLLAERFAAQRLGDNVFGVALSALAVHGAVLAKLVLRSLWLCHALERAEATDGDDTTIFQRSPG